MTTMMKTMTTMITITILVIVTNIKNRDTTKLWRAAATVPAAAAAATAGAAGPFAVAAAAVVAAAAAAAGWLVLLLLLLLVRIRCNTSLLQSASRRCSKWEGTDQGIQNNTPRGTQDDSIYKSAA